MIDFAQEGAVATLTASDFAPLARGDCEFANRLRDAVRHAADEDSVKAIVIRASGGNFALPPTPDDLRAAARVREGRRQAWHAAFCAPSGLYQNLAYCKKFTVTAVRGLCAGAGGMLVLCTDHTVCATQSSFEEPFSTLPESSLVLAALTLRLNRAKSWMLGGAPWDTKQALHAGLVNHAVDAAQVDAHALAAAQAAAKMPLDGVAMTKLLFEAYLDTQGVGQDFDMAGMHADALQRALHATPGERA